MMRNLTIKRMKSFVGAVMKIKIYMEDAAANELAILGAPCRKLGEVKNGGELTVEIDEDMHTIYAIVDVITKDSCVDKAEIPAGADDVTVSGKNRLAPLKGNPFVFED